MNTLISLLSIVLSIGSIVCFVIVLIKLFSSEGIWMGLLGLICGLYALYWGYKNREKHNLQNVVTICSRFGHFSSRFWKTADQLGENIRREIQQG